MMGSGYDPFRSSAHWRGRSTAGPFHYRKSGDQICCNAQQRSSFNDVLKDVGPGSSEEVMWRREFIAILGCAAPAWLFTRAQRSE
jgi:hypothetical protein